MISQSSLNEVRSVLVPEAQPGPAPRGGTLAEAQNSPPGAVIAGALTQPTAWYAVRTASRAERLVGARLGGVGIPTFIPSVVQRRRWSDRFKFVPTMLFPGYVFSNFRRLDFPAIRSTKGVFYVAPVGSDPISVPEWEIESLRRAVDSGIPLDPIEHLEPGRLVEVCTGPLEGVVGRFVRRGSKCKLILAIDLLQQGVEVELSEDDVTPVSG